MDYAVTIDSELSLAEIEDRCEKEQEGGYQLDNVKYGTVVRDGKVFTVNKAEFNFESTIKILNNLHFVEVGGKNANEIVEQKKTEGWILICNSEIYVQNHISRVLVFGKKS